MIRIYNEIQISEKWILLFEQTIKQNYSKQMFASSI